MQSISLDKNPKRNVVELSVGGKFYRITRVVTGVRKMYADYMARTGELVEKAAELERKEGESEEDHSARVETVSAEVKEFHSKKEDLLYTMLELILSRNGYQLDREWWELNTDLLDQQQFLDICLTKDAPAQKKTMMGNDSTTKS